ncbi:hypothetical protein [Janthinobacterium sp. B9-8]|uniref:hypothetical protein n=1 Tax=Janthinobacterium sp. B9-8 TaxID=1236179 RepID=UPI00061D125B|nr:hypothetical protein [Janthinobacterium sp. B9-8]AMC34252.1 hypothetical protein VN23_06395 [Janthinobacterium sp. B9-8]
MNGRITLYSRLFIGIVAYFLCGLANSAVLYIDNETGKTTSDPLGFTISYATSVGYSVGHDVSSNTCPGIPIGAGCVVSIWAKTSTTGIRINRGFTRIKASLCDDKKNQSAGIYNIPIPGVKMPSGGGAAVLFDSGSFNSFSKSGFPTCIDGCETVANGPPIKNSIGGNVVGDTAGNAFMRMQMKFTGEQCTVKENGPKPNGSPFPPDAPKPKEPNGPQDCPEGTSFGTISWGDGTGEVKRCLSTSVPPPIKPGDLPAPDACIGNCDKWDPKPDDKPTDPKDPKPNPSGPSGTGTGTGTGTRLPASSTSASSASASGPMSLAASCEAFKCVNADPATCEIARLAWHEKCLEEKDRKEMLDSALYKSGVAAMDASGTSSIRAELGFSKNPMDLEDSIKQTRFLGSGGLSDFNVVLMGQTVPIPISKLNKFLEAMGNIAVAFTLLAAVKIVSSSLA